MLLQAKRYQQETLDTLRRFLTLTREDDAAGNLSGAQGLSSGRGLFLMTAKARGGQPLPAQIAAKLG